MYRERVEGEWTKSGRSKQDANETIIVYCSNADFSEGDVRAPNLIMQK